MQGVTPVATKHDAHTGTQVGPRARRWAGRQVCARGLACWYAGRQPPPPPHTHAVHPILMHDDEGEGGLTLPCSNLQQIASRPMYAPSMLQAETRVPVNAIGRAWRAHARDSPCDRL